IHLVRVPQGRFHRWFGPRDQDTLFKHDVEVSMTEVTRGQFAEFARQTKHQTLAENKEARPPGSFVPTANGGPFAPRVNWKHCGIEADDVPVTCVAWEDAVAFCNWLSQYDGKEPCYSRSGQQWICRFDLGGYRLPTEAEWEYAARGSASKQLLPVAVSAMDGLGWFRSQADGKPHPVGKLAANTRELHDMWGNVWEWCWDWFSPDAKEPQGPASGDKRAMWGGGWNDAPEQLANLPRRGKEPEYRSTDIGFRVVRTVSSR